VDLGCSRAASSISGAASCVLATIPVAAKSSRLGSYELAPSRPNFQPREPFARERMHLVSHASASRKAAHDVSSADLQMHTSVSAARWRSTASLDDLAASALGALGLRGGPGRATTPDNSSAAAPAAERYRYPVGNHGRRAARCALRRGVLLLREVGRHVRPIMSANAVP